MEIKAYAKINISLDVVGKRSDGYHLLEMIMQTIDLYDVIKVEKIKNGIELDCNKYYVPKDERNIAYKAAVLFKRTYGIKSGVKIYITKNIPVCAGLAGGSTDAAAVLKLMNNMFNINANNEELRKIAVTLGADVPYCIQGGTALCEGIGEKITFLKPFKDKILVLIKPKFGVSTKEVYKEFDLNKIVVHPKTREIISNMEKDNLEFVAHNMKNLLENVTLRKNKTISFIKEEAKKKGCIGTMMSGSGPTVFAFFDDMYKAQQCYDYMRVKYKDVFLTRTI